MTCSRANEVLFVVVSPDVGNEDVLPGEVLLAEVTE